MKTLEELIESMLLASEVNRQYREENADVLHYLKCYQDCLKQMENNQMIIEDAVRQRDAHIKALAEMKRNDPLTWDELIEMQGKPVWVEVKYRYGWWGQWEVIDKYWDDYYVEDDPYFSMTNDENRHKKEYGITWKAYRKERDENAG